MEITTTFLWTIVNFVLLLVLLRMFLFKPVSQYVERRQKYLEDQVRQTEKDRQEAAALHEKYVSSLSGVKVEAQEIIDRALRQGEESKEDIIRQARDESQRVLERTRRELELEKTRVIEDLKREAAALAVDAAAQILESSVDGEVHDRMVKKFISEVGGSK